MKLSSMHPLETDRLCLRQLRMTDLEAYHQHLSSDPEVSRYMLGQSSGELAYTEATIKRRMASCAAKDSYFWVITWKEADTLIGVIALLGMDEATGQCSFAYMLGKVFWGQGIVAEALRAVLDFAFRELEAVRVAADHFLENSASGRVMEKAGMHRTEIQPRKYEKNGVWHDAVCYAITREEWLLIQENMAD